MVQRCSVPLCDTKVGEVDVKGAKVRFHRIPLTPEKFMKWRNQITHFGKHKPEPELTVNSRICSKHFLREDYIVNEEQKPGTAGNHVLAKDAVPTIFKWTDEANATLSRAIPYVKKADLQVMINGLSVPSKSQEVQCSLEEDRLKIELQRKNMIIRQLLQRLGDVEREQISCDSNKEQRSVSASISTKTDNNCQTLNYMNDGDRNSIVSLSALPLRTHSPEMPTLKPSISVPNTHVPNTSPFTCTDTSNATDYGELQKTAIQSALISTQGAHTQTSPQIENEACPINVVPVVTQRVSVIKRAGSSCKSADFSKPPKKRRWSYFYGN